MVVKVKKPVEVTFDEFVGLFGYKSSPSRSPDKWSRFVTVQNYGLVAVNEGIYPLVIFDVAGHPEMSKFAHFVPIEPASKLFPKLYAAAKEAPESFGLKIHHSNPERAQKDTARLEGLRWTPSDCIGLNSKTGLEKAVMPSPSSNRWKPISEPFLLNWCVPREAPPTTTTTTTATTTPASSKASAASKRKIDEVALPDGFAFQQSALPCVLWTMQLPVGNVFSVKKVGGSIVVNAFRDLDTEHATKQLADAEAVDAAVAAAVAEDAGDAGDVADVADVAEDADVAEGAEEEEEVDDDDDDDDEDSDQQSAGCY
tara:strand:- start:239 stop:1177 length:939 start_codon:yes stop_codon:yes gene_type:complete